MTITTIDYLDLNGLRVAKEFHQLMDESVIPATGLDSENFWSAFAKVLGNSDSDKTRICDTAVRFCEQSGTEIPVRECDPDDAASSWGSLYEALYSDSAIPHSAGLKPGTGINAARRDRVVRCAKDFLDKTYPLTEGSHRDAVSYMVYFQNLLVILADGSTTGLQQPKQFIGKNGPTDKPDSILLEHNGTHTEIQFDSNGRNGSSDLASIDDIQLQSVNYKLFDFNAGSVSQKCSTYSNWMQIVKRRYCKTFSNQNGDCSSIECSNWAITTSITSDLALNSLGESSALANTLIIDQHGNPVPAATIDTLTAAIVNSVFSKNHPNQLNIFTAQATAISDGFVDGLQQMLALIARAQNPDQAPKFREMNIKVFATSADNPAQTRSGSRPDALYLRNPATAIINTMQSHGYDMKQAASM